jgi:hypothetical protein
MVWALPPEMSGMVQRMISTAYRSSIIPAAERELARMRIAELPGGTVPGGGALR